MSDRVMTESGVREIRDVTRKKPKEADLIGKKGYKRTYRADGSYTWTYNFKPNDHGKVTRAGAEVAEMMKPFIAADTERHLRNTCNTPTVVLKDQDGKRQLVADHLAEAAVQRNGWRSGWRAGGVRVERGPRGMLFRLVAGRWEPTGKVQLGFPGKVCPRRGIQYDPEGGLWRWFHGAPAENGMAAIPAHWMRTV